MTPIKRFIQCGTEAGSAFQLNQQQTVDLLVVTNQKLAAEQNMTSNVKSMLIILHVTLMYVVSFMYIIMHFSWFHDLWICICCLPVCTFGDSAVYSEPFYCKQLTLTFGHIWWLDLTLSQNYFYKHAFRKVSWTGDKHSKCVSRFQKCIAPILQAVNRAFSRCSCRLRFTEPEPLICMLPKVTF